MKRILLLLPLTAFLILALFLAKGLREHTDTFESKLIGQKLPAFTLPSVYEMQPGVQSDELRGEYALVNVFASWCVSCLAEHPHLMKLAEEDTLPIYGINWKDKQDDAVEWLAKHGNPYTDIGADTEGEVAIALGITGAPESFLVNPQGEIVYHFAGVLTPQIIQDEIVARVKK